MSGARPRNVSEVIAGQAALRRAAVFRAAERLPAGLRRALPARRLAVFLAAGLRADLAFLVFAIFAMVLSFSLCCQMFLLPERIDNT